MIPNLGYLAGRFSFKCTSIAINSHFPLLQREKLYFRMVCGIRFFSCALVVFLSLLLLGVNKNNLSLAKKKSFLPVWQNITN